MSGPLRAGFAFSSPSVSESNEEEELKEELLEEMKEAPSPFQQREVIASHESQNSIPKQMIHNFGHENTSNLQQKASELL